MKIKEFVGNKCGKGKRLVCGNSRSSFSRSYLVH